MGPLLPKNLENKILLAKKSLKSILSLFSIVTLQKKSGTFWETIFHKTWKSHFELLKQDFSQKADCCNFKQKNQKNSTHWVFCKTRKTSFWSILAQKPQEKDVFTKFRLSLFKLDDTLTSRKKNRKN